MSEMSMPIPTKPPRGTKSGKETGILMTVIKTLSATVSTDLRDKEKTKLEREYKKSDQKLDSLILTRQESLNSVMQTFAHVCNEVDAAKLRIKSVKTNLLKCKSLLKCRREELERLWLEGIEHKHAMELLDQIEKLRSGSDQFNKLLNRKQYLQAVETLMGCLDSWNDSLKQIEGLKDVHNDLKSKKDKIYATLMEELYNEMYQKGNSGDMEKRQGSGVFSAFQRSSSDRRSSGRNKNNQLKARKLFLDVTPSVTNNVGGYGKSNAMAGENQESDTLIDTIVKCIVLLKELPKFSHDLRHQMEAKLLTVVNHTSQQIIEFGDSNGINESDAALFQELLQVTFSHFRWIVRAHGQLIIHMKKAADSNRIEAKLYSEEFVWSKVQTVLQSTLKIYFDLSDAKSNHGNNISGANTFGNTLDADINSYFVRRKQPRQKKIALFKFEYSMHGLNINDYVPDQDGVDRSVIDKHRFLVCKPNPRNIIVIYGAVQNFVVEIEEAMNGKKSELRKFMSNNVNRVFVQQIYKEVADAVEMSKRNADCWKDVISIEEAKSLKCHRPLLQSVVSIGRSIQEVISLSKDLPSHSDQLIKILDALLTQYRETCQDAYAGIVQPDAEDKGVISATWVKDEDIERLLKSLPNWAKLQKAKEKKLPEVIDESPEDLRAQNIRESDLLNGIFNGKIVLQHEILSDVRQLEQLSHLQESLEWFADIVSVVASSFETIPNLDPDLKPAVQKIYAIGSSFQDLADTCLLVLHLEIRVHCFYYLLPMAKKGEFSPGVDTQIPDPEVVQLNKALSDIENVLNSALQPMKTKYVFQGVGQLISTVLIGGAQDIQRINDNGVKKLCRDIFAIQQTLCNITNQPEHAMDHARQYYELFLLSPEELVNAILEKGPQFKELEYVTALKLLFRSKPGLKPEMLDESLNRLSNILGDIGVVV